MRIAILYICTGKYNVFWGGFYKSSEKYFLSGQAEKDAFECLILQSSKTLIMRFFSAAIDWISLLR